MPEVDQLVEVVPEGSINSWGLVVVVEPPVNHVPSILWAGVEAAPAVEIWNAAVGVAFPMATFPEASM